MIRKFRGKILLRHFRFSNRKSTGLRRVLKFGQDSISNDSVFPPKDQKLVKFDNTNLAMVRNNSKEKVDTMRSQFESL